ncbi:hypothetical protein EWM64_g8877 [Hericium alpestre]|uniref:Uncharacterized protein n=1 Tax=Hericium alpestre TaxID=135208 RepID=A0A4Y9ZKL5_9AGAM|nr:hypothetical protein EWM64_g8877 [Hericium alpestre]
MGPPRHCTITTLDPARLDSSCFLDISDTTNHYIYDSAAPEASRILRMTYTAQIFDQQRFPPHTHGFLYFHRDEQNPLASQIRFRVTQDSDPARGFASGRDLMYGSGYVWHIPLALVDDALLGKLQAHYPSGAVSRRVKRGISALSQPFLLEFKQSVFCLTVRVMGKDQCYKTNGPLTYHTKYGKCFVYAAGSALCRLERSTLPQDAGRRIVVMRLLKIVRPPKRRLDVPPTCNLNVPVEGELFARGQRVWYRDVGKPGKGAEILRLPYDAPNDGEQASGQSS